MAAVTPVKHVDAVFLFSSPLIKWRWLNIRRELSSILNIIPDYLSFRTYGGCTQIDFASVFFPTHFSRPSIIHLSCHCENDALQFETIPGELIMNFEDEPNNFSSLDAQYFASRVGLTGTEFQEGLSQLSENEGEEPSPPRLLFLNCCKGEPFAEQARSFFDYVIFCPTDISDVAASTFSASFYTHLFDPQMQLSVVKAFFAAKQSAQQTDGFRLFYDEMHPNPPPLILGQRDTHGTITIPPPMHPNKLPSIANLTTEFKVPIGIDLQLTQTIDKVWSPPTGFHSGICIAEPEGRIAQPRNGRKTFALAYLQYISCRQWFNVCSILTWRNNESTDKLEDRIHKQSELIRQYKAEKSLLNIYPPTIVLYCPDATPAHFDLFSQWRFQVEDNNGDKQGTTLEFLHIVITASSDKLSADAASLFTVIHTKLPSSSDLIHAFCQDEECYAPFNKPDSPPTDQVSKTIEATLSIWVIQNHLRPTWVDFRRSRANFINKAAEAAITYEQAVQLLATCFKPNTLNSSTMRWVSPRHGALASPPLTSYGGITSPMIIPSVTDTHFSPSIKATSSTIIIPSVMPKTTKTPAVAAATSPPIIATAAPLDLGPATASVSSISSKSQAQQPSQTSTWTSSTTPSSSAVVAKKANSDGTNPMRYGSIRTIFATLRALFNDTSIPETTPEMFIEKLSLAMDANSFISPPLYSKEKDQIAKQLRPHWSVITKMDPTEPIETGWFTIWMLSSFLDLCSTNRQTYILRAHAKRTGQPDPNLKGKIISLEPLRSTVISPVTFSSSVYFKQMAANPLAKSSIFYFITFNIPSWKSLTDYPTTFAPASTSSQQQTALPTTRQLFILGWDSVVQKSDDFLNYKTFLHNSKSTYTIPHFSSACLLTQLAHEERSHRLVGQFSDGMCCSNWPTNKDSPKTFSIDEFVRQIASSNGWALNLK